ncbi:MAG: 7,8-dihydropterin-6-methyl-4-(beta-D-ribofuranosy l)-aminobenzene-5'-phosphate synthase [Methanoregula sp. SKADARSKE-2]|nr:MAG: 7,8-dihydropterin-6-methyl-4-(beta-D-ribofuranosy l)-aminobenzene-5'-phosphate synthase [Methanoregula sp. SKADARSKE-2]
MELSLTVLTDDTKSPDNIFAGEFGLSFFLETGGKKILFDTGYSDVFLANAGIMGINVGNLDYVVLSHGHNDHTGGLIPLSRYLAEKRDGAGTGKVPELIAHTRCLYPKPKGQDPNTGSILSEDEVKQTFSTNLSDKPVWITDDLVFLGEIPRRFPYERTEPGDRRIIFPDGSVKPDLLLDDSALAFRSGAGLVILSGCSHAGISNIAEYALEVCEERMVTDIIGGLHLLSPEPERLARTGKYLNRLHLKALHVCHCTSADARVTLADYCPVEEAGVGMRFRW